MENLSYIKLFRKLLKSPIFENEKALKVWIWCLLKATYTDKEQVVGQQIVDLKKGDFVFGRKKASEELKMSESTVYKYIKLLEKLQTISVKSNNKFSVVSIEKWEEYQVKEQQENNKGTTKEQQENNKGTTKEQQRNTNKNIKNIKNIKKREKKVFSPPSLQEIQKYIIEKNLNVDANRFYSYFTEGNWVDSKGNKVKNWKQKIITWSNHTYKTKNNNNQVDMFKNLEEVLKNEN